MPPARLVHLLGVDFVPELLTQALTHSSYGYEQQADDYERLEFLGDSVLGLAVAAMLYGEHPDASEGELSRRHHALVSTVSLAEIARGLELGQHLRLGRSEQITGGRDKDSILADAVEALIGAAYLSAGPAAADALVRRLVEPIRDDAARFGAAMDPKTALLEALAAAGGGEPDYETRGEGPDHDRTFTATLTVRRRGKVLVRTTGSAPSKKHAELAAALEAWHELTGTPRHVTTPRALGAPAAPAEGEAPLASEATGASEPDPAPAASEPPAAPAAPDAD
ncbi:MAG: ribonuclease III [Microbacteriaceae bacterium]|nr:ribonuclease III [Microbacteriaceae bacterium]